MNNSRSLQDLHARILLIGLLFCGSVVLSMAAVSSLLLRRQIILPTKNITEVMKKVSDGHTDIAIPFQDQKDELGEMARAVEQFRMGLLELRELELETRKLQAQNEETRRQAEETRALEAQNRERDLAETQTAVQALELAVAALSQGNLTYRIEADLPPVGASLKHNFNLAIATLEEAMAILVSNTHGMKSAAGEVSQAADDLSKRTEHQAATLEETAAALDEITATVRKTAEGAKQANSVVTAARSDAAKSSEIVSSAVGAMGQISESASQIGQIIGVIDEIAFQTNLLALNAGVEAARAGDAGRGFAVVASEVRALAQRSAGAAKEIKGLIQTSNTHVDNGVELVGQTGAALQRISSQISDITVLVSEIAASAQEQATGLSQVNTAVNQMDQVTQQNAAMVEQSTAASHHFAREAAELARLISNFQIGNDVAKHHEHAPVKSRFASKQRTAPRQRSAPDSNASLFSRTSLKSSSAIQLKPVSQTETSRHSEEDGWEEF